MLAEAAAQPHLQPVHEALALGLARVRDRFDRQLQSPDAAINALTTHVGRYRGKMLRPVLTLLCGLATHPHAARPAASAGELNTLWNDDHILSAAVCEMVHMATLVHDDILDEADVRRGVRTINALKGNEAAVMLGDLLIAHAYDLANTSPKPVISRVVSQAAVAVCSGELLQLSQRGNLDLTQAEYFRIVAGKTGALIAAACRLGAISSDASTDLSDALADYGDLLGTAFQIQDDILDLTGDESTVGKSVRKDLEKGKMTLPLILALDQSSPQRASVRQILAAVGQSGLTPSDEQSLGLALAHAGSIDAAHRIAAQLVARAKNRLDALATSPVKDLLLIMADAVIDRAS
jgi:octaprenyl-diphosphate synthase